MGAIYALDIGAETQNKALTGTILCVILCMVKHVSISVSLCKTNMVVSKILGDIFQ